MNDNIQPQVAQLQLLFPGPLVKDSILATKNDLTLLDIKYNYSNKLIWIADEKTFYYLKDNVDGSDIDHWQRIVSGSSIPEWVLTQSYSPNTCVHHNFNIYVALTEVPANTPIDSAIHWQLVTGVNPIVQYTFTNSTAFEIEVPILYPVVTCWETFPDNTMEVCYPTIRKKATLSLNGHPLYTIDFGGSNVTGLIVFK